MKYLIIGLLIMGSAKADMTFDVSVYAASKNNFDGFMLGTTIGDTWISQIAVNSSANLGGVSVGFGRDFGKTILIIGMLAGATLETEKELINVFGIPTKAQDRPELVNAPWFIELEHRNFFIRYTEYEAEYTLVGTRYELISPTKAKAFRASEDREIDESVIWLGYRVRL